MTNNTNGGCTTAVNRPDCWTASTAIRQPRTYSVANAAVSAPLPDPASNANPIRDAITAVRMAPHHGIPAISGCAER